jgi:hypothetical protein
VGGGRVDDARTRAAQALDHRDRLARRVVVQTQHDQVDLGHQGLFGLGVFALGRVDAHHFHAGQMRQTFADLQPGGAGFAVDENCGHGACQKGSK